MVKHEVRGLPGSCQGAGKDISLVQAECLIMLAQLYGDVFAALGDAISGIQARRTGQVAAFRMANHDNSVTTGPCRF